MIAEFGQGPGKFFPDEGIVGTLEGVGGDAVVIEDDLQPLGEEIIQQCPHDGGVVPLGEDGGHGICKAEIAEIPGKVGPSLGKGKIGPAADGKAIHKGILLVF